MKYELIEQLDVTNIQKALIDKWISVTGTKPVIRKIKKIPENKEDEDWIFKMKMLTAQCGGRYSEVDERVTLIKEDTMHQSLCVTEIKELWEMLHKQVYYTGCCCICGNIIESYRGFSSIRKTCYKRECQEVRDLMLWYLRPKRHKIKMSERVAVCKQCNKEYPMKRKDGKFCSGKCRVAYFRKIKEVSRE